MAESAGSPIVSDVRLAPAPDHLVRTGLVGWLQFRVDALLVDCVGLRRTVQGRWSLSFPERRTSAGAFPYVRPCDAEARQSVEDQVLAALNLGPEATP